MSPWKKLATAAKLPKYTSRVETTSVIAEERLLLPEDAEFKTTSLDEVSHIITALFHCHTV